jgi:hypothetical protein
MQAAAPQATVWAALRYWCLLPALLAIVAGAGLTLHSMQAEIESGTVGC